MGTRSLTRVIDRQEGLSFAKGHLAKNVGKSYINMYKQYDGYIGGMGVDLAEFLLPFTVVNGIGMNEDRKIANGSGCLAAQIVAHFKSEAGGVYLHPTEGKPGDCWEAYIYTIFVTDDQEKDNIMIAVYDVWKKDNIFIGTPAQLLTKHVQKETV
jgi:hypothetical protein